MNSEFIIILKWYFLFFLFGIIGLGVIHRFTGKWPDRGYGLAKFVGLLLFGTIVWFVNSYHLTSLYSTEIFSILLIALIFIAVKILKKENFRINKTMILQEIFYTVIFIIWCAIRSTNSQIEGTEKFMNLAFMNSINRTEFVPAIDPWITNGTINYYYFGHFLFGYAGRLIGIPMAYAYNLAMVTIIAHTFTSIISILTKLTNFRKNPKLSLTIAFLTALAICFGSNMHYGFKWVESVIYQREFTYWFPDGTRIIPNVIDEFPAYSITLADLHGHYLGMPFLTLVIAALLIAKNLKIIEVAKLKFNLMTSILIVALFGINTWDFITANVMFLFLHIYQTLIYKGSFIEKLKYLLISEVSLIAPGIVIFAVYIFSFKPSVGGLGFVPWNIKSDIGPWLLMWGMFLLVSIFTLITAIIIKKLARESILTSIKDLFRKNSNTLFVLFLNFMAMALIIGVEFFYVRDIFEKSNAPYFRTNTVFKFYFQAWVIWGIACGYYVFYIIQKIFSVQVRINFALLLIYLTPILIFYLASISYIAEAVNDFYSFFKYSNGRNFSFERMVEGKSGDLVIYKTLDGNDYIRERYPEDYAAINWINENVEGQPVILEAVGGAYTYFSRISTNTGLQTPMGWPTHQWQWRDNSDVVFKIQDEVNSLYSSPTDARFQEVVKKYKVEFIIVGGKEREIAPNLNESIFEKYARVVFEEGETRIYQINR